MSGDHEVKSGAPKGPAVLGLECGNVEKDLASYNSVRELNFSLLQEILVESFDFLAGFDGRINGPLDPLDVVGKLILLGVQGAARFMKRVQHGLRCFRLSHNFRFSDVFEAYGASNCNQFTL